MATRNEENNIEVVLNSLVNQHFSNFNIIVTDRSTDNTLKLANNFIHTMEPILHEKNIHIQLLAWDNKKFLVPSKVGQLEHAFMYVVPATQYIVYADADIYYPPTWLPCLLYGIFCGYDVVFSSIKTDNRPRFLDNLDVLDNQIVFTLAESALVLKIRGIIIGGSTIFKRSLYDAAQGYTGIEHSLIEDAALGDKFFRHTKKISFINDIRACISAKPARNFSEQWNQKLRWTKTIWEQQNPFLILLFLMASLYPLLIYSIAVFFVLLRITTPTMNTFFFLRINDILALAVMWFVFDTVIILYLLYKAKMNLFWFPIYFVWLNIFSRNLILLSAIKKDFIWKEEKRTPKKL